eukprot:CAMPEP_0195541436 /NCGR_PEP_ID=MMETSP0794_2-20130614/51088_1 /TAXON_ID=515487 /ORGANISM="Stephanopyxis turris, Strain CCMP 815" /LENGTH=49 /DNA_ID= /DNA_START= /DNA_END= /DNA_ORIENTATION=
MPVWQLMRLRSRLSELSYDFELELSKALCPLIPVRKFGTTCLRLSTVSD